MDWLVRTYNYLRDTVYAAIVVLDGYMDVPAADAIANAQMRDVIGNKTDTALQGATMADSLMRYMKGMLLSNA